MIRTKLSQSHDIKHFRSLSITQQFLWPAVARFSDANFLFLNWNCCWITNSDDKLTCNITLNFIYDYSVKADANQMKKEWHVNIVQSRCNVYRKQIRIDNRVCTIFLPVKLAQYHFLNDCKSTSIFGSVVCVARHPPHWIAQRKKEVQQGKCIEKSRELSSVWEDDSFLFLMAMV